MGEQLGSFALLAALAAFLWLIWWSARPNPTPAQKRVQDGIEALWEGIMSVMGCLLLIVLGLVGLFFVVAREAHVGGGVNMPICPATSDGSDYDA